MESLIYFERVRDEISKIFTKVKNLSNPKLPLYAGFSIVNNVNVDLPDWKMADDISISDLIFLNLSKCMEKSPL